MQKNVLIKQCLFTGEYTETKIDDTLTVNTVMHYT